MDDIYNAFDSGITYAKGSIVLAMFERFVGAETFQRGRSNDSQIVQFGNSNGALVHQRGRDNNAGIGQNGDGNFAGVDQRRH